MNFLFPRWTESKSNRSELEPTRTIARCGTAPHNQIHESAGPPSCHPIRFHSEKIFVGLIESYNRSHSPPGNHLMGLMISPSKHRDQLFCCIEPWSSLRKIWAGQHCIIKICRSYWPSHQSIRFGWHCESASLCSLLPLFSSKSCYDVNLNTSKIQQVLALGLSHPTSSSWPAFITNFTPRRGHL